MHEHKQSSVIIISFLQSCDFILFVFKIYLRGKAFYIQGGLVFTNVFFFFASREIKCFFKCISLSLYSMTFILFRFEQVNMGQIVNTFLFTNHQCLVPNPSTVTILSISIFICGKLQVTYWRLHCIISVERCVYNYFNVCKIGHIQLFV